jgi:hypothetical protein
MAIKPDDNLFLVSGERINRTSPARQSERIVRLVWAKDEVAAVLKFSERFTSVDHSLYDLKASEAIQ